MASASDRMIEVEGLCYEYPGVRALDDVSFALGHATITALVGPNGAGKTTLMRCLAGMDRPLVGGIRIHGVDVIDEPRRSHRDIGYLSDFFGLYGALSVRRSLAYVAAANGVDARELPAVVAEIASELGLAERLDQATAELSRGLRQRVAIAQAIIHRPAVLILDEPASGLDPEARFELGQLFRRLRERGLTLLVSSHILAELEAYSTHMLILRDGRLVDCAPLAGAAAATTTLEIEVVGALEPLCTLLGEDARVSRLEALPPRVRFEFSGDPAARVALLKCLIEAGIEVAEFVHAGKDLQQFYLRSVSRAQPA